VPAPRLGRPTPAPLGARPVRALTPAAAAAAAPPLAFRDPRAAATAALAPGTVVAGRYALAEVLGAGGTGIVYRVTDLTLGETVALKMLRPDLVAGDPRAREELKHELRLTRRVSHRNVVRTYDFGTTADGLAFITMEYVRGPSLAAVLAHRGALPHEAVLALAKQLVRALEAAHEHGVVHGDLKPANVLVAMDGLLKVADFGVATLVRRPPTHGASSPRDSSAAAEEPVTPPRLAGAVVGTPEYMAPELLLGAAPDARADLYAAGMVLHECLTGATPFQRDTPRAFLSQKLDASAAPPPPAAPPRPAFVGTGAGGDAGAEPATLEAIVARLSAPDPADRPPSAAAVAALLARLGG
jgi:serine/threonine-protein kinase